MKTVFVTLVYDGMPFLRHHPEVFRRLKIPWEWHVVEGVALLRHDTAWSVPHGGKIPAGARRNSLSTDGTTEFLDRLREKHPDRIFLHRKPAGGFWDGKIEMERAYLPYLQEPCLLWEISSDELWAPWQIENVVQLFQKHPGRSGAYFWCNFYVGPDAVVGSRHGFSQDPDVEWLRVYRYRPGDRWRSHEPNVLVGRRPPWFRKVDVGAWRPFTHAETEAVGAVFDHWAYATREQVDFKESYYGYRGLRRNWQRLQRDVQRGPPVRLGDYFPWVKDETLVGSSRTMGIQTMARRTRGGWRFRFPRRPQDPGFSCFRLLLDGDWAAGLEQVLGRRGVEGMLRVWARTGFARRLQQLDRTGHGWNWPGVMKVRSSKLRYLAGPGGRVFLDYLCRKQQADLLVLGAGSAPRWTPWLRMGFSRPDRRGPLVISLQNRQGSRVVRQALDQGGVRLAAALRRILEKEAAGFRKAQKGGFCRWLFPAVEW